MCCRSINVKMITLGLGAPILCWWWWGGLLPERQIWTDWKALDRAGVQLSAKLPVKVERGLQSWKQPSRQLGLETEAGRSGKISGLIRKTPLRCRPEDAPNASRRYPPPPPICPAPPHPTPPHPTPAAPDNRRSIKNE